MRNALEEKSERDLVLAAVELNGALLRYAAMGAIQSVEQISFARKIYINL